MMNAINLLEREELVVFEFASCRYCVVMLVAGWLFSLRCNGMGEKPSKAALGTLAAVALRQLQQPGTVA